MAWPIVPSTGGVLSVAAIFVAIALVKLSRLAAVSEPGSRRRRLWLGASFLAGALLAVGIELLLRRQLWIEPWPGGAWWASVGRAALGGFAGVATLGLCVYFRRASWTRDAPYTVGMLLGIICGLGVGLLVGVRSSESSRLTLFFGSGTGVTVFVLVCAVLGSIVGLLATPAGLRRPPRLVPAPRRSERKWYQYSARAMFWCVLLVSITVSLLTWDSRRREEAILRAFGGNWPDVTGRSPMDEADVMEIATNTGFRGVRAAVVLEAMDSTPNDYSNWLFRPSPLSWSHIWEQQLVEWYGQEAAGTAIASEFGGCTVPPADIAPRLFDTESFGLTDREFWLLRNRTSLSARDFVRILEQNPNGRLRTLAAEALYLPDQEGRRLDDDPGPLLAALASDPGFSVRRKAAFLLGIWKPERAGATSGLIEALGDDHPAVRAEAAEALGSLVPPSSAALPALRPLLRDDHTVRGAAVWAIARIDAGAYAEVRPVLAGLLQSDDKFHRRDAVRALRQFGLDGNDVADMLLPLLDDPDRLVRNVAYSTLAESGGRLPGDESTAVPDAAYSP
jgi:hypothetical protein